MDAHLKELLEFAANNKKGVFVIKSGVVALGFSVFLLRCNYDINKGIALTVMKGIELEKSQQIKEGTFHKFETSLLH